MGWLLSNLRRAYHIYGRSVLAARQPNLRVVRGRFDTAQRALMVALASTAPQWRKLSIHECSPIFRGVSALLKRDCSGYLATYFFRMQYHNIDDTVLDRKIWSGKNSQMRASISSSRRMLWSTSLSRNWRIVRSGVLFEWWSLSAHDANLQGNGADLRRGQFVMPMEPSNYLQSLSITATLCKSLAPSSPFTTVTICQT